MTEMILSGQALPLVRDVGFTDSDNNWIHPARKLPYHVCIFCLQGRMQVIEEQIEHVIEPDQILFLMPDRHHHGSLSAASGTRTFWLHFYSAPSDPSAGPVAAIDAASPSAPDHIFSPQHYAGHVHLPQKLTLSSPAALARKAEQLYALYRSNQPLKHLHLSLAAYDFLLTAHDEYQQQLQQPARSSGDWHVNALMQIMAQDYRLPLDPAHISNMLQLNYRYLSTLFSRRTGMSISDYQQHLRMDEAKRLLTTNRLPIGVISEQIGYDNPLYFSRVFRKAVGCSPSAYRTRYVTDMPFK